jgi:hypothetical protein
MEVMLRMRISRLRAKKRLKMTTRRLSFKRTLMKRCRTLMTVCVRFIINLLEEIVDLVSGTEFVTKEELFSTSSKVLKSGKLMGAEISEITSKIQDLRAGSNEDEVEM